jgi:hypothetical protein
MAVIINLKEIFATDSQVEVSSKVNFNFNQLIALGIGQAGPTGSIGPIGPAGPIGPIGPAGPIGSTIYGTTPATAAASIPSGVPTGLSNGDILITADKVLKKVATSGSNIYGWDVLTDFNVLVQSALGTNISPYVRLGSTSRIVKPRVTAGLDLTNSSTTGDPNVAISGLGNNYQTILYNFNELKTRSLAIVGSSIAAPSNSSTELSFNASSSAVVGLTSNTITISAGHGLSTGQFVTYSNEGGTSIGGLTNNGGYYVYAASSTVFSLCETSAQSIAGTPVIDLTGLGNSGTPHKFITYPAAIEGIFPQTANLSLYSFYNNTATPAKEFETSSTAKGYRGQLELGSLDTLPTAYPGVTAQNFVISPSFENLRIRKYRIGGFTISGGSASNPGNYMLRAEYDISSTGSEVTESFAPRRNSEHVWKINKAGVSQAFGRTLEMKFTNSFILDNTESTSIEIDGIFLKRGTVFSGSSSLAYVGFGFDHTDSNKVKLVVDGVTFLELQSTNINLAATRVNALGVPLGGVNDNRVYISKNPAAGTNTIDEQSGYLLTFRSISTSSDPIEGTRFGGISAQKNFNGTPSSPILPNTTDLAGVILEVDAGYELNPGGLSLIGVNEATRVAFHVSRFTLGSERRAYINSSGSLIFDWDDAKTSSSQRNVLIAPRTVTNPLDTVGVTIRLYGGAGLQGFAASVGGKVSIAGGNGRSFGFDVGTKGNVYLQSVTSGDGDYKNAYGVFVGAPESATSPASFTVYPNANSFGPFAANTETVRVLDTTNTPRFTLDNNGAATSGLRFPSSFISSADLNTLDRYAEGEWAPLISGDISHTTIASGGQWTRIGRDLHVHGWIRQNGSPGFANTIAAGNHIVVSGLPEGVSSFKLNDARVGVWTEVNNDSSLMETTRFFGSGNVRTGNIVHSYHHSTSGLTSFKLWFVGYATSTPQVDNPLALNLGTRTITFSLVWKF